MSVGDDVTLGAVVNNNGDTEFETEVTLEGAGIVFKSDTVQRVKVPARGNVRVDWQVQALELPAAVMTFTANPARCKTAARQRWRPRRAAASRF